MTNSNTSPHLFKIFFNPYMRGEGQIISLAELQASLPELIGILGFLEKTPHANPPKNSGVVIVPYVPPEPKTEHQLDLFKRCVSCAEFMSRDSLNLLCDECLPGPVTERTTQDVK